MRWKNKTKLTITGLGVMLAFFFLFSSVFARTFYVTRPTYFLSTSNEYVIFTSDITLTDINKTGGYWYFTNYGFKVQDANITVSKFFLNNQLIFTASADSGNSTTNVYVSDLGRPDSITGCIDWEYDTSSKILTITVEHSSDQEVIVYWETDVATPGFVLAVTLVGLLIILPILLVLFYTFTRRRR